MSTDYVVNMKTLQAHMGQWPIFWNNFVQHIDKSIDWTTRNPADQMTDMINEYFADTGATLARQGDPVITFKSEADFLIFKLQWS